MKHDGVPSSDAALSHILHVCFPCLVTFPGEQQLFGKFHFVAFDAAGRRGACKTARSAALASVAAVPLSITDVNVPPTSRQQKSQLEISQRLRGRAGISQLPDIPDQPFDSDLQFPRNVRIRFSIDLVFKVARPRKNRKRGSAYHHLHVSRGAPRV